MPKLTRIYTRTGDDGTTGLVGGQRVKKNAGRIEAYGTVDELSSAIGLARTALADVQRTRPVQDLARAHATAAELDRWLAWTQDVLFNLGAELATRNAQTASAMPKVTAADVEALERAIDRAEADLAPLDAFIHPGGAYPGAFLHLARTICRRAERLAVALNDDEPLSSDALRYLNRLSDALFVWSRWINAALDRPEHRWNSRSVPPADA